METSYLSRESGLPPVPCNRYSGKRSVALRSGYSEEAAPRIQHQERTPYSSNTNNPYWETALAGAVALTIISGIVLATSINGGFYFLTPPAIVAGVLSITLGAISVKRLFYEEQTGVVYDGSHRAPALPRTTTELPDGIIRSSWRQDELSYTQLTQPRKEFEDCILWEEEIAGEIFHHEENGYKFEAAQTYLFLERAASEQFPQYRETKISTTRRSSPAPIKIDRIKAENSAAQISATILSAPKRRVGLGSKYSLDNLKDLLHTTCLAFSLSNLEDVVHVDLQQFRELNHNPKTVAVIINLAASIVSVGAQLHNCSDGDAQEINLLFKDIKDKHDEKIISEEPGILMSRLINFTPQQILDALLQKQSNPTWRPMKPSKKTPSSKEEE